MALGSSKTLMCREVPKYTAYQCDSPLKILVLLILISLLEARSHSREKRLLHSSCPSVRPSACSRKSAACTGRVFMKFGIKGCYENLSR